MPATSPRSPTGRGGRLKCGDVAGSTPVEGTSFVAPATVIFRHAHIRGSEPVPPERAAAEDPVEGLTVCGMPMVRSELWQVLPAGDVNAVCGDCRRGGPVVAEELAFEVTCDGY